MPGSAGARGIYSGLKYKTEATAKALYGISLLLRFDPYVRAIYSIK